MADVAHETQGIAWDDLRRELVARDPMIDVKFGGLLACLVTYRRDHPGALGSTHEDVATIRDALRLAYQIGREAGQ